MAGGWEQAARLPAIEALAWASDHLREKRWDAHSRALQIWAARCSVFTDPPDPPEPPED